MKNIGLYLRQAREEQGMSLKALSELTRIKPEFLTYLEEQKWENLPELPVVVGFVKSVADVLELNREQAVAFLRRDYPPRSFPMNPKPDLKKEVRFGPRFLMSLIVLFFVIVLGGYLYYQYKVFTSPPMLSVVSPAENELVTSSKLRVIGTTETGATIRINGQPIVTEDNGNFTEDIDVAAEMKQIEVKALSRTGRETVIRRTINVQLPKK